MSRRRRYPNWKIQRQVWLSRERFNWVCQAARRVPSGSYCGTERWVDVREVRYHLEQH